MPSVTHYSITLPDKVAALLQDEAEASKTKRSTLIAQHLEQHYNAVPTAQYEIKIQELEKQAREYEGIIQDLQTEATEQIQKAQKETSETAALEIQQLKQTLNQQASKSAALMQKVQAEMQHAQAESAALMQKVKMEAANKAASQDLVIKGIQNELEVTKTQTKSLEEKLVIYTGLNNDLKVDKETLQKQLELVTLRLPAPKVGFWSRVFSGGRKKEE
jgi:hypothetical protein